MHCIYTVKREKHILVLLWLLFIFFNASVFSLLSISTKLRHRRDSTSLRRCSSTSVYVLSSFFQFWICNFSSFWQNSSQLSLQSGRNKNPDHSHICSATTKPSKIFLQKIPNQFLTTSVTATMVLGRTEL
ncbi:unnamed protein product [Trifolium pratense]|uniref:Uncharacterized protein n=1 Tax=Trifolium pratense TaxID=57577 RepID=A0ACB0M8D3_TRIPR|nr:unnamed protein product [Trifolium pratense]